MNAEPTPHATNDVPATQNVQPAGKGRRRWRRRLAIAAVVLFALYTLFGFFGVPLLIKTVGLGRLQDRLHGQVSLAQASFNPFTLDLVLQEFEVVDAAGERLLAFERFDGNFQLLATVFNPGLHFLQAEVTRLYLNTEIAADGSLNLAQLVKPTPEPRQASEPLKRIPHIVVERLGVEEADLRFRDLTTPEPFVAALDQVSFRLDGLDTNPSSANPLRLVATTPTGERLTWEGRVNVDPLSTQGVYTIEGLDLAQFMPYAMKHTEARLVTGRLSLTIEYQFAPVRSPRVATATLTSLRLEDVNLRGAEAELLALPALEVTNITADAHTRTLTVERVALSRPSLQVRRDASGDFEWLGLVNLPQGEVAPALTTATEPPALAERVDPLTIEYPVEQIMVAAKQLVEDALGDWELNVEQVVVEQAAATWLDASPRSEVELRLRELNLRAGPIRSSEGFKVPFELTGAIAEQGRLACSGNVGVLSQEFSAHVDLQDVPLAAAAPYLPQEFGAEAPPADLAAATLRVIGDAQAAVAEAGGVEATWEGIVALTDIDVVAPDSRETLLALGIVEVKGRANASRAATGALAVQWEGTTTLRELAGNVPLAGPVDLTLGDLAATGRLGVALDADADPRLSYTGDLRSHEAALFLPEIADTRAGYAGVLLTGIEFDTESEQVHIAQAQVQQPTFSGQASIAPKESAAEPDATAEPATPREPAEARALVELPIPFAVTIDRASITGAAVELVDDSGPEPVTLAAQDINVDVTSITTDGSSNAMFEFSSKLNNFGRLNVAGEVNPFTPELFADVQVELATLPLKPYDPFAGHYVGYLVDRGRLTLSLPIKVEEGALAGSLDANLDTFYLGEKVNSPVAPDLPIKLGLGLLRNRQEQIDVSVGIQGNLHDPSFSFGNIILQAFLNTLGKAALAPFDLLASVFAGDDAIDDLSMIAFEAGSANLNTQAIKKLDVLARALTDRPALQLSLAGSYLPEWDEPALREALLLEQVLARVQAEDPSLRILSDAQVEAEIAKMFAAQFPERVIEPIPVPPGRLEQPTVSPAEMRQAVVESIEIPLERLQSLAQARAQAAFDVLTQEHGLAEARITALEPVPAGEIEAEQPLVQFDLR